MSSEKIEAAEKVYTTQQVCEKTGVPMTTLMGWINKGFIVPSYVGGKGRGNSYGFSPRQLQAIKKAEKFRRMVKEAMEEMREST